MLKRLFDIVTSSLLILLLMPLMVFTAVALFLCGRPVFFSQLRPGKAGNVFALYKFQTMSVCRDSNGELLSDAERLTSLGQFIRKLSLDELPQLWNVLKGDMSLVGPRPLLCQYLPLYTKEQMRRHEVKPGITGWAQVNGRNALSWEEKFELDVWYVDNQSFLLDIKILFMTAIKLFYFSTISHKGSVSMPTFKGSTDDKSHG